MNKALNPAHIAPPYKNRYSHAIEVTAVSYTHLTLPTILLV